MLAPNALIRKALSALRAGGVVAIPTETVYGLAADARSEVAVARVFALKGRPSTNPLIVHVASVEIAERYATLDDRSRRLFTAFSPGPLTVVLPRLAGSPGTPGEGRGEGLSRESKRYEDPHPSPLPAYRGRGQEEVSRLVTAGLDTVGIRIPNHPLALELLRAFDGPLAAPSANQSNHVSPTTADHVRAEFGDAVPILDGGPCQVGIESTVISLAMPAPTILRPGSISRAAIEAIIGQVELFSGHVTGDVAAASPGQQAKHYAPRAPAFCVDQDSVRDLGGRDDVAILSLPLSPIFAAREFYAKLRALDACNPGAIAIVLPPDEPAWHALRDRILRATQRAPLPSRDQLHAMRTQRG